MENGGRAQQQQQQLSSGNCNTQKQAQQKTYDSIWYAFYGPYSFFCFFLYNEMNAKAKKKLMMLA